MTQDPAPILVTGLVEDLRRSEVTSLDPRWQAAGPMAREKGQIGRSLARYVRAAAGDTATETNARQGRRLPVTETTAAVITGQQQRVRHRFPDTSVSRLVLLPTVIGNPDGSRPVSVQSLIQRHHDWIGRMPALALADGREFDKATISPYCYRHTYAQRHAHAGVALDVLRDLMNHRNITATLGYYRIGEDRRREAVDRVAALQFDRHGNRIWRDVKALLDAEHARYAIGEVAVPYGRCGEPSNVAAGGGACPIRPRDCPARRNHGWARRHFLGADETGR